MCGIQIGREQLKSVLAHSELVGSAARAACGIQIGREELSAIISHSQSPAIDAAKAACGIQIGAPEDLSR